MVESAEVSHVKLGRPEISDHELMGVLLGAVGVGEGLVVAVAEVVGFVSVRYSLETFERFEQDKYSRVHAKYEKKRILPFLNDHKEELMEFWNMAMKSYIPPQIGENGCQYCKES